jgi:sugar lactone lactonase YvrE
MGIGITGANVGYSRAAADDRFAKASSPTQTITAGTISASEYTGGLINGNTIIDSDVGKTFGFVGSFTGGADVTLLQTKTSPYVYSSDGENTPAATGAWYGVFIDEAEPVWILQYYFDGSESAVGTWYGGSGSEPQSGTWTPSGETEGDMTVTIDIYQNTLEVNDVTGITLNSNDPNSGFVSISGTDSVTIAGGVLNFNSSDFAYASGGADLHRTALGLGTTDSPSFSSITTNTANFNIVNSPEYDVTGTDGMLTTSNDIRTWVRGTNEFSVGGQESQPQGLTFSPDGTYMFVTGQIVDRVYRYVLNTPWNTTTAVLSGSALVTATGGAPTAMYFTSDGLMMFILDSGGDRVGRYSLTSAWDVSTATLDAGQTKVLTTISGMPAGASFDPRGLEFNPDGRTIFVCDDFQNSIYEISLDLAWDLTSTMTLVRSYFIATTIDNGLRNISFNNDGTRLFVAGFTNTRIYEFKLATPYSLENVSFVGRTVDTANDTNLGGMYYNDDAQKCFYVGNSGDTVREFIATPQPALIGTRPIILANLLSVNDRVLVNSLQITDTTVSTNTTTGALLVAGGVGVGGTVRIGSELFTGGQVQSGGQIQSIANVQAGSSTTSNTAFLGIAQRSKIFSSADGLFRLTNNADTDFNRIQLGGTSSNFPAIKRNGTGIDITDGTGLTYTSLAAGTFVVNNNIVTQTDDFTISGTDAGKYIRLDKASGVQTITLTGASILEGHEFMFYRATSATIALSGGIVNGGTKIAGVAQYDSFGLKHLGNGTFDFI